MGEVVLRQPGHHTVLLHVRPAGHVHNQIACILPVPGGGAAVSSRCQAWGLVSRVSLAVAAPT